MQYYYFTKPTNKTNQQTTEGLKQQNNARGCMHPIKQSNQKPWKIDK